jgi:hypothetical protein
MPDLEIDGPDSISFTRNQAPMFDVLVTNTSNRTLEGCTISGSIDGAEGIYHHMAIYPLSEKFHIAGGTQQPIHLTIPPGGLPSVHTPGDVTLLVSCAGFRTLKQAQHITLSVE